MIQEVRKRWLLACIWFSRLPVKQYIEHNESEQKESLVFLPLIGLVLGGSAMLLLQGWHILPWDGGDGARSVYALAGSFLVLFWLLLWGALLHEDGWADGWDALGVSLPGAEGARKRLEVMKDPRLGSFGVAALFFTLGVQLLFLYALGQNGQWWWLPYTHVLSRLSLANWSWKNKYVRASDLSQNIDAGKAVFLQAEVGMVWKVLQWFWWPLLMMALWFFTTHFYEFVFYVLASVLSLLIGAFSVYKWKKTLGGVTGDILGFAQQSVLLSVQLLFLSFAHINWAEVF
jgi:adenosylcobinamide-GDP ribazoletransferase